MEFSLDFWIRRPLESEVGNFNRAPAFWPCANKMVTYLLEADGHPECHGVRPRSLRVTTISALTTEVAKGQENLSQLAIRGNYRVVADQDMARAYPRNIAQRQLSASGFSTRAFQNDTSIETIIEGPLVFSEN